MKIERLFWVIVGVFVAGMCMPPLLTWLPSATAAPIKYTERASLDRNRACAMSAGGWTVIDCSAAAAYSAELEADARYLFQSTANDTYLSMHSAGSGGDADANDCKMDDGEIVDFVIKAGVQYATCLGTANSGKIKYIECE